MNLSDRIVAFAITFVKFGYCDITYAFLQPIIICYTNIDFGDIYREKIMSLWAIKNDYAALNVI